jgi:VWFA-related protein
VILFSLDPRLLFTLLGILLLLLVGNPAAQETTFSSQSTVVLVPTLVRDARGNAVYGLQSKDFIVEDDGVQQTVHLDEEAESEPISVVVAVQTGRRAMREFPQIRGLGSMLQPVFDQPQSRVALVEFDSKVSVIHDFTHNDGVIHSDLEQLQPGDGGAAILDAVDYSVKLLEQEPKGSQRVLLLISETRDQGSKSVKVDDVIREIGNSNTVIYALPFSPSLSQVLDTERGSNKDERRELPDLLAPLIMTAQSIRKNVPKTLASMTGGEYELFSSSKSFESDMTGFTNHLHSRYLLSFQPQNPHPGLHEIEVHLADPGTSTVLFRTSYWAQTTTD